MCASAKGTGKHSLQRSHGQERLEQEGLECPAGPGSAPRALVGPWHKGSSPWCPSPLQSLAGPQPNFSEGVCCELGANSQQSTSSQRITYCILERWKYLPFYLPHKDHKKCHKQLSCRAVTAHGRDKHPRNTAQLWKRDRVKALRARWGHSAASADAQMPGCVIFT